MSNKYEDLIKILIDQVQNTQMTEEEYRYLTSFMGDKSVLIFGTGRDSDLYRYSNKNGITYFLEDNPEWIPPNSKDVFKVDYTFQRHQAFDFLDSVLRDKPNLGIELPDLIKNTKWDVIFVDAPWDGKHGRMQSIYESVRLLKNSGGGDVFLHDCDRPIENIYSTILYGENNLVKELLKLRHYKL